jgi:hypothetical protein
MGGRLLPATMGIRDRIPGDQDLPTRSPHGPAIHRPDGVRQQLYAYLITYQAIRALMHHAALTDDTDPDRLSFTTALRAVRRWISTATTPTALAVAHAAVLAEISQDHNHRRQRSSPRVVKRSQAPYPAKRHAQQPASTNVGYAITVIPKPSTGCVTSGVGIVEGWRGTIVHRVEIGPDQRLTRVKVVDPSFFNWPALPVALAGTIVPDFPLANKSFNLSYAGNDL